jgi:hypothetical protein
MATLRITTQYYENYSDTQTPHWKPKGGQTFIIKDIEGDMIMYCDNLTEVCKNLVSAKSNEHVKYDYRDHEVDFIGDEEISVTELTKEIRDQFNGDGKYAPKDIPGFEGTLDKLNDLCDNMISHANSAGTVIECSANLDNEMANESENI